MRVTLPSGPDVKITVVYDVDPDKIPIPYRKLYKGVMFHSMKMYRFTYIHLKVGEKEYSGYSSCSPADTFDKFKARRIALEDLFSENKDVFSKEDRKALWSKLCSKYAAKPQEGAEIVG